VRDTTLYHFIMAPNTGMALDSVVLTRAGTEMTGSSDSGAI